MVAATSRVTRNPDTVGPRSLPLQRGNLLTVHQNANDPAHHSASAATIGAALVLRLEVVAMAQHSATTATTTDPDLATSATAKPRTHQNQAVATDLATLAPTVQILDRASRSTPSLKRHLVMFR